MKGATFGSQSTEEAGETNEFQYQGTFGGLVCLLSTPEQNGPDGDSAPGIERTIDHA